MGCCGKCCSDEEASKVLTRIKKDRGCTDILFFLLFVASWSALFIILQQAQAAGADPDKVLRGVDMNGNICGRSPGFENTTFAAWPNPKNYDMKICVSSCEYTNECTSSRMAWKYPSIPFMDSYCIPNLNSSLTISIAAGSGQDGMMQQASDTFTRAVSDIWSMWHIELGSAAVALVITFLFAAFLRRCAGVLVFICLGGIVAGMGLMGFSIWSYGPAGLAAGEISEEQAKACEYGGYTMWGLTALFLLIILALRKQIKIAIAVVKEAAEAIDDMKLLILFPILPMLTVLGYLGLWAYIAVYIASVTTLNEGVPVPEDMKIYGMGFVNECVPMLAQAVVMGGHSYGEVPNDLAGMNMTSVYVRDETWRNYGFYHFFHLLWVIQFFFYFGYLVFAGATADWYFTPRVEGHKKRGSGEDELSNWPICESVGRTCRYHLGTVSVTSLIIAIVQFVRYWIMYIEKQTRGSPPNKLQKAIFVAITCYLKLLECCLDKLNKNALIWTAIWGDGFFTAACAAFQLLWRNLGRVAAINMVSGVVLILGKVACATVTAAIFCAMMTYHEPTKAQITSPMFPAMMIWIIAYMVASLFMAVFHSVIDTVFLCFLVDAETNPEGKMLASERLQKLVGKYSKESAEAAELAQKDRDRRPGDTATNKVVRVQPKAEEEGQELIETNAK